MSWISRLLGRARVQPGSGVHGEGEWLPDAETPDELPIGPLVHPLRYDVIVRKNLFDVYAADRDRWRSSPDAFLEAARHLDYMVWFRRVMLIRRADYVVRSGLSHDEIFAEHVRAAAELYESIAARGFDRRRPVVPFTGVEILPADGGAVSQERFFVGDGCHRLACLMSRGMTVLPRSHFRVRRFARLRPYDNTRLLEGHLDVEWPPEYISY